jgi:3,2-trans-enoyl-CoA isomerase
MCVAVLSCSLLKDIFTAGNDIRELYSKSTTEERFTTFWLAQQTFLTRLYTSRLATVAAIRGACPAGGCIFSLCCDYRVMTSDVAGASIGLNEVALGISVPRYWVHLFIQLLGPTRGELALLSGQMLSVEKALEGGLLHALVPKASLIPEAERALSKLFLSKPDAGRVATKLDARREFAQKWQDYAPEEAANAWKMLSSPQITAAMGAVLQRLSGGGGGGKQQPQAKL